MARRAVVHGAVHGVGFRIFAERTARALAVRGWVRNLPDGSVETVAEGDEAAVAEYLALLTRGPASARVDRVDVETVTPRHFTDFEVTR